MASPGVFARACRCALQPLALLGVLLCLAACESKPALREWQPSDHQPPPTVMPEGQGQGAVTEQTMEESTGRAAAALWEMRCASCHGTGGKGDGAGRPPGAQMPDLSQASYRTQRSDEELHTIIKQGRGLMPPFATQLTDLGIDALIKHVRTFSGAP